jgi:hypothetical protein
MGVVLNTWYKWSLVASFTFVNTVINDFMSDAISPWILNTVTDHKTRYIPYSKLTCLLVAQMWAIYCNVMGVLSLFLSLTQFDFVLIKLCADLLVNCYTNLKFMNNKVHDPEKYRKTMEMHGDDSDENKHGIPQNTTEMSSLNIHTDNIFAISHSDDEIASDTDALCRKCSSLSAE